MPSAAIQGNRVLNTLARGALYIVIATAFRRKKSIFAKQNVSGGVPSSIAWSKLKFARFSYRIKA